MPGGVAAVDANGEDAAIIVNPTPTPPPPPPPGRAALPLKVLLLAVLATSFLDVAIFLSGSTYSLLPRFSLLDALSSPLSLQRNQACAGDGGNAPLERWTRAPASAWHNMTDDELLWAASWQPMIRRRYPYRRTPKVAFMFLTRGPLPLAPLWDAFFSGAGSRDLFSVYVHATPGYYHSDDFPPTSAFHRRHVPSKAVEWGEASMFDAERRLLANALLDPGNDRFVLLSESCVPLYSFSVVYGYLTRSNDSFVDAFDDPGLGGRGRYPGGLAPEVTPEQWRKGSQWFELRRDLAVVVVADELYYPKFREHCRPDPDCYVDEHYLPTVMSVESPARIANRSVTWVDWSRHGAHPATFGEQDVDEAFLRRLTAADKDGVQGNCTYNGQPSDVCFLFARKLAPNTLQTLLNLAPKMLGYG